MKKLITLFLLTAFCYAQERIVNENTLERDNNNGTKTMIISAGERFYRTPQDTTTFDTIDNKWVDSGTYFVIFKNKYNIRVKKQFTDVETFQFIIPPEDLTFEPDVIIIDSSTTKHPINVTGYLKDAYTIRFDNCYGTGIHYEIQGLNGFNCQEIIDSNANLGYFYNDEKRLPKGDGILVNTAISKHFEIKFRIVEKDKIKEKTTKIKDWDGVSEIRKNKIDLGFEKYNIPVISSNRNIGIPEYITKGEYILESKNSKKYISKSIDINNYSKLSTSLSTTYITESSTRYSTTRNSATSSTPGDYVYYASYQTGNPDIMRSFLNFQANLPANITVTAVVCSLYCEGNDFPTTIHIVKQWGSVPPVSGDFTNFDYSGLDKSFSTVGTTVSAWSVITLNANGISYVQSRAGQSYVQLGLTTANDLNNSFGGVWERAWYCGGNAGHTTLPLLNITYTSSSGTVKSKKPHIINMKTF